MYVTNLSDYNAKSQSHVFTKYFFLQRFLGSVSVNSVNVIMFIHLHTVIVALSGAR